MDIRRLAAFMDALRTAGMSRENVAVQGYSFALAYLRGHAELSIKAGESIPNGLDCKLMEQAAELLAQATRMGVS